MTFEASAWLLLPACMHLAVGWCGLRWCGIGTSLTSTGGASNSRFVGRCVGCWSLMAGHYVLQSAVTQMRQRPVEQLLGRRFHQRGIAIWATSSVTSGVTPIAGFTPRLYHHTIRCPPVALAGAWCAHTQIPVPTPGHNSHVQTQNLPAGLLSDDRKVRIRR
jgi:hypothetical protein